MQVVITAELLASAKTTAGGYTRAQMDVFDVDWPPPKGWPSFLIGRAVELEVFERFVQARNISAKQLRKGSQDDLFG